ncbi:glutamate 5-kinase [bacterium]|nr:glutamate 5-kinase [bacterium]
MENGSQAAASLAGARRSLKQVHRLVVKIGTRVLTGEDNNIALERIDRLAARVVALQERGMTVVLVSSGAVGAGMGRLGLKSYPRLIPDRQAVAAVGQVRLMKMWEHAFEAHGRHVGQVLVTAEDFQNRRKYVNLQNTFESLLRLGVVPVVNENDSVAVRELKYGDNDSLSAHVTALVNAELLVILTDIDGLYTASPKFDPSATRIPVVSEITAEMQRSTRGKGSEVSIGGMKTKLAAAELVTGAGRRLVIASGRDCDLDGIVEGRDIGTLFVPRAEGLPRRKQWIAFSSRSRGRLLVDEGARRALAERAGSLLSSGVRQVQGSFEPGDVVEIVCTADDMVFAKGVSSYSAEDLERIKGLHSSRINEVLGHAAPDEVVHKDNLVLLNGQ